jgi:hypothetical protein
MRFNAIFLSKGGRELPKKNLRFTLVTLLLIISLLATAVPINADETESSSPDSEPETLSPPSEISIWEAHAKGYAPIISNPNNGLAYIITNSGSIDIEIDEYVLLMSPNPYQTEPEDPTGSRYAQDGALTFGSISAGGSINYNYGSYVVGTFSPPLPPPAWWCTEDSEYTAPNVPVELTGEIMPFDLWDELANPDGTLVIYDRGDASYPTSQTQGAVWTYLRNNAAPVVGKLPMWKLIPNIPTEVDIDLAVTNIGFQSADDVVVVDTLPADYELKAGSSSPIPSSKVVNPDGTTTLTWNIGSMRGAIQTADNMPTDYAHLFISYTLITPLLAPDERYFLPRAQVDKNNDGTLDSHSEIPLLETYLVNSPPVAVVNGVTIDEGQTATLDGSSSYDPDEPTGDYIVSYEWDLDFDGTVDSYDQIVNLTYKDNGIFPVSLLVTDTYGATSYTTADVTVLNVAPSVAVNIDRNIVEVSVRMAGSKWSNVGITLYEDDTAIGYIEVERWPGSPDDNPTFGGPTIPIVYDSTKIYKAVVTYDPYPDSGDEIRGDQPNNGKDPKDNAGNPIWLILTTENGTTKIHHTFNTQQSKIKKSKHWNHVDPWEVEINGYLGDMSTEFAASAYDPGADDLTFTWDFNDGTLIQNFYPNSGGTFPVNLMDSVDYSGPATEVTLTCEDDDGGIWVGTYTL